MKPAPALLFSALLALAVGCGKSQPAQTAAPAAPAPAPAPQAAPPSQTAAGTVTETMDAAGYTYVKVKGPKGEIWAAASQFKVKVGDKVIVPLDMPMENFKSNSLNRTFPVIYFTSKVFFQGEPGAPA